MAKMISMDLRTRVVAAVQAGSSRRAAASRFGVSASCAVKLLERVRATGSAVAVAGAVRLVAASSSRSRRR